MRRGRGAGKSKAAIGYVFSSNSKLGYSSRVVVVAVNAEQRQEGVDSGPRGKAREPSAEWGATLYIHAWCGPNSGARGDARLAHLFRDAFGRRPWQRSPRSPILRAQTPRPRSQSPNVPPHRAIIGIAGRVYFNPNVFHCGSLNSSSCLFLLRCYSLWAVVRNVVRVVKDSAASPSAAGLRAIDLLGQLATHAAYTTLTGVCCVPRRRLDTLLFLRWLLLWVSATNSSSWSLISGLILPRYTSTGRRRRTTSLLNVNHLASSPWFAITSEGELQHCSSACGALVLVDQ